ncbi:hypothetical protein GTZ99_03010 [Novosphingobium sp. FSY-8]|uniref:Uncharacterized protein n=1 Tax=Novosphingobium ovatum TaxID=1908523 RepID=A0ABW9XAG4_9SPHN|nr:hypothetical protein [Novosphingobium ovatum]NBC35521.1 hypothetical protein [Novosphingobium ovatum]
MHAKLHTLDCACHRCVNAHPHPSDHRMARHGWTGMALFLFLFWAFPGRWLLAAGWAALSTIIR